MSVHTARPLRIDGDLTVQCAADYKGVLLSALEAGSAIELDLSGVIELDTAGLQLLLLLKREAQLLDKPWRLLHPSEAVQEVLALARLDQQLNPIPAQPGSAVVDPAVVDPAVVDPKGGPR